MKNFKKGLSMEYDPNSGKMLLRPDLPPSEPVIPAPPDTVLQPEIEPKTATTDEDNYNSPK